MHRVITFWAVWALLFFAFTPGAHSADSVPELVILYTGDTIGHVEPCG